MDESAVLAVVLAAMEGTNRARVSGQRIEVSPTAALFGAPSPLDSLGLVGLLIDIEEAFERAGHAIVLADERALSETRSPFRDVPSLVAYIVTLLDGR